MSIKSDSPIDLGLTIPEVVGCLVGAVPDVIKAWVPDRKIDTSELREILASFLDALAAKANPEASEALEALADLIDLD